MVLIDVLKDKAEGEAMDLNHGVPYDSGKMDIKAGDYDECKDADIVVLNDDYSVVQTYCKGVAQL